MIPFIHPIGPDVHPQSSVPEGLNDFCSSPGFESLAENSRHHVVKTTGDIQLKKISTKGAINGEISKFMSLFHLQTQPGTNYLKPPKSRFTSCRSTEFAGLSRLHTRSNPNFRLNRPHTWWSNSSLLNCSKV